MVKTEEKMKNITISLPRYIVDAYEGLRDKGHYPNRSVAIRTATKHGLTFFDKRTNIINGFNEEEQK